MARRPSDSHPDRYESYRDLLLLIALCYGETIIHLKLEGHPRVTARIQKKCHEVMQPTDISAAVVGGAYLNTAAPAKKRPGATPQDISKLSLIVAVYGGQRDTGPAVHCILLSPFHPHIEITIPHHPKVEIDTGNHNGSA